MTTGLVYDKRYLEHDPGEWHPECSARLSSIMAYLEKQPWFSNIKIIEPRPADMFRIEEMHSKDYIRRAEEACQKGYPSLDCPDVGICSDSFDVAKLAVGGALALGDSVMKGEIQNGMALVRPPGHHAEKNEAMGFCIFNNIAILARYLQKNHSLDKILIFDWDVHHGNGTQHAFEEDSSVLYVSIHQYPFYPGTGAYNETGKGQAKGTTLNCPMPAGSGDDDYKQIIQEKILPRIKNFKPDAVLVSAGFDAYVEDPISQICLSTEMFGWMTDCLMEVAQEFSGGKILSLLEGGYNIDRLGECVEAHLLAMNKQS